MKTFKNLQDKVLRYLDEAGDTDSTLALVKDALNDANTARATQEKWPFMLWERPATLSIVAGQQYYTLHHEYFRPYYFWNRTQQDWVTQIPPAGLPDAQVDWNTDTGAALRFQLLTRAEVAAQPSAASVLTVTSTNAGDAGKTITVRGDTVDGVTSETIAVGTPSTTEFTRILKVTKVDTFVGTLTLSAGSETLLTLFASEVGRSYQTIFFPAIPDADEVVEYRFYRQPYEMVEDNDRPEIPSPFEDLLVYDALLYFATYNQYDASVVKLWLKRQSELEKGLRDAYLTDEALESQRRYIEYIPR